MQQICCTNCDGKAISASHHHTKEEGRQRGESHKRRLLQIGNKDIAVFEINLDRRRITLLFDYSELSA